MKIEGTEDTVEAANKLLTAIRDEMMHFAIDKDGVKSARAAAVAAELITRIDDPIPEPPSHIDPREVIEGDIGEATDAIIRKYADSIATEARKMDGEERKLLMGVVAELDTRCEGGHR